MMLNRRDAILSTAAVLSGVNTATASTSSQDVSRRPSDQSPQHRNSAAAATCSECASACSVLARECVNRVASGDETFVAVHEIAQDCSDICTVAATLLGRQGPLAPAICQAGADACDRLVSLCTRLNDAEVRRCEVIAGRCARACRALISRM